MICPACKSVRVFLCSGGYYICSDCEWYSKKELENVKPNYSDSNTANTAVTGVHSEGLS